MGNFLVSLSELLESFSNTFKYVGMRSTSTENEDLTAIMMGGLALFFKEPDKCLSVHIL